MFYELRVPKVVKKQLSQGGAVQVTDALGRSTHILDQQMFGLMYVPLPEEVVLARMRQHAQQTDFDEYQAAVSMGLPDSADYVRRWASALYHLMVALLWAAVLRFDRSAQHGLRAVATYCVATNQDMMRLALEDQHAVLADLPEDEDE